MRAGFHRAPVVARGNHHRVDAVHNALVVGRGAVGVGGGKSPGRDDAVAHLLAAETAEGQGFHRHGAAGAGYAAVGQVGKDAQMHPPAGEGFQPGGKALARGVDRVGAHRVAHVVNQMHHQEVAQGRVAEDAHFQVARPAAQPLEHRVNGRSGFQNFGAGFQNAQAGFVGVGHIQNLDLPDHFGRAGVGGEATAGAGQFRHVGSRSHHRRLFDGHRHQHLAPVDHEVEGNA